MLKARWLHLMQNLSFSSNIKTFEELIEAYSQKHRFYHNLSHIEATLKHLDQVKSLTKYPAEIELALWFHDSIYKPFSSSNEYDSAQWALRFLKDNGADETRCNLINRLIMATLHTSTTNDPDEQLMVDIDLSILGCPSDIYKQFESNVRLEYKFVPFFLYRKKRLEILNSFLNRNQIYQTDFFFSKFESNARENIKSAIVTFKSA